MPVGGCVTTISDPRIANGIRCIADKKQEPETSPEGLEDLSVESCPGPASGMRLNDLPIRSQRRGGDGAQMR